MLSESGKNFKVKISKIQETTDCLTGRGGLAFVSKYLFQQKWLSKILKEFEHLKQHKKGVSVSDIIMQMILNFVNGENPCLDHFDRLKNSESYSSVTGFQSLVGASSAKRFLLKCSNHKAGDFRKIFNEFFKRRLLARKPNAVFLDVDTVVFDNDSSECKEGCEPTYKKVKGFQPLMIKWDGFVVANSFRPGNFHGNHGDEVRVILKQVIEIIRETLGETVPVIITFDSGFFDQKIMEMLEKLEVGFVMGGKIYKDITEKFQNTPENELGIFEVDKKMSWYYMEFKDCRKTWKKKRRTVFTCSKAEGKQLLIKGMGRPNIVYTNLGMTNKITARLRSCGYSNLCQVTGIIELYHKRGEAELLHRHIKDFAGEKLPCKDFGMNKAYFNIMLTAFNLYQAFKEDCLKDVSEKVIEKNCYPASFRRQFIDFAGKIVHHAGEIVLKVQASVKKILNLDQVWARAAVPL